MTAAAVTTSKEQDPKPKRITLASVSKGKIDKPHRVVLYGLDGVGKSSFAAGAPSPIFIGAEDGTSQLDVARFPKPERWSDVTDAITELATQEHEFKTLVIDTLDWLEPVAFAEVCMSANVKSIEDIPYGGGYKQAAELWHKLLAYLERLQNKTGMHVVLLAHSHIRQFKNPQGEDFDRYELKLNAKIAGMIREWPQEVLFANYQTFTHERNKRVRGISDGSRVIHTTRDAAFDAKNRHGLPDTIPLNWDDFDAACKAGQPASAENITAAINDLLGSASEELRGKVSAAVKAASGDASKLAKIFDRAKATINDSAESNSK